MQKAGENSNAFCIISDNRLNCLTLGEAQPLRLAEENYTNYLHLGTKRKKNAAKVAKSCSAEVLKTFNEESYLTLTKSAGSLNCMENR